MAEPKAPQTGKVSVSWTMREPPVPPSRWHAWSEPRAAGSTPLAEADDRDERGLGWPAGTISLLREAFDLRLPRATGWEASGSAAGAVRAAARAFRRGVAFKLGGSDVACDPVASRGTYEITVAPELTAPAVIDAARVGPVEDASSRPIFCVLDANVARHWPAVAASLRVPSEGQTPLSPYIASLDEHTKTLASVAALSRAWREAGSPPHWLIIGGGLLTDVAAYAAHLCGCSATFVPTTLLAMADACIGGKTGVNFAPFGKNQLGAFYFPAAVHAWPGWLATLPARELAAGGAECLKHAFLSGDDRLAAALAEALSRRDVAGITARLREVIAVKADIVAKDPTETGCRATLNLGHTLGHAIESLSQSRTSVPTTILHGEAVALGLAFALRLSQRVAGLKDAAADLMIAQLQDAHCLPSAETLAASLGVAGLSDPMLFTHLAPYLALDKKNADGSAGFATYWILLERPGKVARGEGGAWTVSVPLRDAEAVWRDFVRTF